MCSFHEFDYIHMQYRGTSLETASGEKSADRQVIAHFCCGKQLRRCSQRDTAHLAIHLPFTSRLDLSRCMRKEKLDDGDACRGVAGNASLKQPARQLRQVDCPISDRQLRRQPAPPP